MTKKLLPKIKAISPETVEVEKIYISMSWDISLEINGQKFGLAYSEGVDNCYDILVTNRKVLEEMYAFLNANLGTHYVVKNDTESNLRDLGYLPAKFDGSGLDVDED